eukprot:1175636-Alexandrium_andersonii.AAC.1
MKEDRGYCGLNRDAEGGAHRLSCSCELGLHGNPNCQPGSLGERDAGVLPRAFWEKPSSCRHGNSRGLTGTKASLPGLQPDFEFLR